MSVSFFYVFMRVDCLESPHRVRPDSPGTQRTALVKLAVGAHAFASWYVDGHCRGPFAVTVRV
jgi:hypothetical protein